MATQNIIDLSGINVGKINPKYIPAVVATIPTLNEVLTTGNQSGGILIDAQGGNINCDALKCLSIEALTAPLFNTIAVDADFIVTPFGKLGFEDNALITCNEGITPKNVIETTNASGNAIYKVAEGNVQYETSSKLLTVNPATIPPSPLLPTQGLTVNGSTSVIEGDVNLQGSLPIIRFKDSSAVEKGYLGYLPSGRLTLQSDVIQLKNNSTSIYNIIMGDAIGALDIKTINKPIRIVRSDALGAIKTYQQILDNGIITFGEVGVLTDPTLKLLSGTDIAEFLTIKYDSALNRGIIKTETNGSIELSTPSVLLDGITTYNTPDGVQTTVQADVDNLDQVLTNNAYIPMTWYKRDIGFTIDPAVSLAFQTGDFIWRYSGLYGTTNSESRYCGALQFQIDVNISAEDMNDTIVWWVRLFNNNTSAPYYSIEFPDERFGFVADRVVNPYSGVRNQCVSFSSTFILEPGFTGQPIPVDGESLKIEVFGWGTTSTTTPRAQVSATIRPLRNMV